MYRSTNYTNVSTDCIEYERFNYSKASNRFPWGVFLLCLFGLVTHGFLSGYENKHYFVGVDAYKNISSSYMPIISCRDFLTAHFLWMRPYGLRESKVWVLGIYKVIGCIHYKYKCILILSVKRFTNYKHWLVLEKFFAKYWFFHQRVIRRTLTVIFLRTSCMTKIIASHLPIINSFRYSFPTYLIWTTRYSISSLIIKLMIVTSTFYTLKIYLTYILQKQASALSLLVGIRNENKNCLMIF
jgi:hypothetical protein